MNKPKYGLTSNIIYILKNVWRIDKILLFAMLAMAFVMVAQPLIGIYMPKFIIQYFEEGRTVKELLLLIAYFGIISLIVGQLKSFSDAYYPRKIAYFRSMHLGTDMAMASLYVDYKYLSSETGQLEIEKARRAVNRGYIGIQNMCHKIVHSSANFFGAVIYILILRTLNPLIILGLIACGIISYYAGSKVNHYREQRKDEMAKIEKKLYYLNDTMRDVKYAKDIRMYGMYDWLVEISSGVIAKRYKIESDISTKVFFSSLVDGAIAFLRDGFAYIYLIYLVLNQGLPVSQFVLYIASIAGFSTWVSGFVEHFIILSAESPMLADFRVFMDKVANNMKAELPTQVINTPIEIELKDVSFAYGNKVIYKDFNLKIEAGKKVALVGVNGAGKTTLIKLILNLLEPDSGQILINGIDIKNIDIKQYYGLFSVAFQDALVMAFDFAVNVAMQAPEDIDHAKVDHALEQAGLLEKVNRLNSGKATSISRYLDSDGTELSGGEAQKLILARALYKDAPILILDEPSAALDPIAEAELYEKYHAMTKNKTSIYISHRLSSTKFCDEVLLLADGKIIERGTHQQLIQLDGKYAEMFAVQSHYYKEDSEVTHEQAK